MLIYFLNADTPPPPVVTEKTAGKGFPYGPVIGTVCGVLLLLLIVAFVVIFLIVRRRKIQNGDNKPIVIKKEMMTETDAMENGLYANKKLPDKELVFFLSWMFYLFSNNVCAFLMNIQFGR